MTAYIRKFKCEPVAEELWCNVCDQPMQLVNQNEKVGLYKCSCSEIMMDHPPYPRLGFIKIEEITGQTVEESQPCLNQEPI